MITTAISAVIEAELSCVWQALTDPEELCAWDANLIAPVDSASDYPCVDVTQRWRYLLRGVQVLLHERPREIQHERRLRSTFTMGGMKLEQTYSLAPESSFRTRVSVKIAAGNSVPILGGTIDRFEVRRLASERVDSQLRALQKWCEAQTSPERRSSCEAQHSESPQPSRVNGARRNFP